MKSGLFITPRSSISNNEGQDYVELRPTISISFLNHVWFPQVLDEHLRFRLLEQSHHFALTEDLEFHIIELPKFTKSAAELASGLDIWLYFWFIRVSCG